MGYIFCLSKGIKNLDRDDLNDWEMITKISEAKDAIPQEVAESWLELNRKGCLPYWCVEQIQIKSMERAAL